MALSEFLRRMPRDASGGGIWAAPLDTFLLAAGIALVLVYAWSRADAAIGSAIDMQWFENEAPDTSLWSASRLREYRSSAASGHDVVGLLRIPQINFRAPLYPDTHESHLNRGVGLIPAMALPGRAGNLGIAGHRDGFFRALKDIRIGAEVEVVTRDRSYRYRVTRIVIVERNDTAPLQETQDATLTLVTCYPFYLVGNAPRRFVVRGELTAVRPLHVRYAHVTQP